MTRSIIYRIAEKWLWIAYVVVGVIVLAGALRLAEAVEQFVAPVVSRFDVLSIKAQPDGSIHVDGTLMKERNCQIARVWVTDEQNRPVKIHQIPGSTNPGSTKFPPGPTQWGPWRLVPDGARFVTVYSEHVCHPLWTTTTLLASFQVTPRYE